MPRRSRIWHSSLSTRSFAFEAPCFFFSFFIIISSSHFVLFFLLLVQDTEDSNPLIRGLAIRTMSYIEVEKITEAMSMPLRKCLKVLLYFIFISPSFFFFSFFFLSLLISLTRKIHALHAS